MGVYKFRICSEEDLPLLLKFIDTYWKKDHILVRSKEIMDFQYYDAENRQYTFLLAENQQTGEIDGIRGWIRVAQFDPALKSYDDVWSAVSKVRTDVQNDEIRLLGSFLWRYLNRHKGFGTVGISHFSYAMHTALGHTMCSLSQYFILNPNIRTYKVAVVPETYSFTPSIDECWSLQEIADVRDVSPSEVSAFYRPFKSLTYLLNRFQNHPVYKYHFWGVMHSGRLECILVGKFIDINGARILRIVDVFGSLQNVGSLYSSFVDLMRESGCEYVDFLCFGIEREVFERMGFDTLDPTREDLVIPNYFEPYLQKNIVINGAYKPAERYTMFKADADQDRPS